MPVAALRPCAGHCGRVVARGRCASCQQQTDRSRRQQRILTYSEPWWRRFRQWFITEVTSAGLTPMCGVTHPTYRGGQNPSQCQAQGRRTFWGTRGDSLHLHHEPPLTDREQTDVQAVTDPARIVLLCPQCHDHETARTMRG